MHRTVPNLPLDGSRVSAFESACIEFFASIASALSVPKSIGQIYGVLYASPAPLCFSEIVDRLGISKGSVSQGLALLKTLGAILEAPATVRESGAYASPDLESIRFARAVYTPELSLRRLIGGILQGRLRPLVSDGGRQIEQLVDLAERAAGHRRFYRDQAQRIVVWKRQLGMVLPILTSLLGSQMHLAQSRRRALKNPDA